MTTQSARSSYGTAGQFRGMSNENARKLLSMKVQNAYQAQGRRTTDPGPASQPRPSSVPGRVIAILKPHNPFNR